LRYPIPDKSKDVKGFAMRREALILAVALVLLPGCSKLAPGAAHAGEADSHHGAAHVGLPTDQEIAALFDRWNATLQNGGPHDMALLYAEDGVLLPTVSNVPRTNRVEIGEYFEHFLQLSPRGMINERYIAILDENSAIDSGIYTFDILRDGVPSYVVARYSFVYERVDGRWKIKSHHSSAMPEPVSARPPRLEVASVDAGGHGEGHGETHGGEEAHAPAEDNHAADNHGTEGHGDQGHAAGH
jgi:uncharacterized protein (TIGR02246 family)